MVPPNDTNPDGTITYTPNTAPVFTGTDTFQYTVDSNLGATSNPTDVTVNVQNNVAPVANNDSVATNSSALNNAGGSLVISVLANDTDANNTPGLPGGINLSSVTVTSQPATGSCTANPNGTITYSQTPPSVTGQFSCSYRVSDSDSFNPPLASNIASVDINISSIESDWPASIDPDLIPVLFFEEGIPGSTTDSSVPAKDGSYFTMQVTPTTLIYTVLKRGPTGAIVVGHDQPASGSHTGSPNGNEQAGIDLGGISLQTPACITRKMEVLRATRTGPCNSAM